MTRFAARSGDEILRDTAFHSVRSPFDGSVIAEVGYMNQAQALSCLEKALAFFNSRKAPASLERARILRVVAGRIETEVEELSLLIAQEGGKPYRDSKAEVLRAASSLRIAADSAVNSHGSEIPMRATAAAQGHMAWTFREPIGVVVAISAFNHPLNLIAHQVGPAVAAGCPVLVKPAAETPLSCLRLVEMLHQAGLPAAMAQVINCEVEVAEALATDPRIAFLTFIGSSKVGWGLRSKLAPGVRCALEHGGAAPVIVDESADLKTAIPSLVKGGYYHSGQVCVSVQRVFVHKKILAQFQEQFLLAVKELKTGDPSLSETDCGPMIRKRDLQRVHEWIELAVKSGAKLLCGGRALGETCYEPTVLLNAPLDSLVMTEEVFGPLVCLTNFDDLSQAIALANDVRWSFQSAIYSQNLDRALQAARELKGSAVMINESTTFRVDWMPFAGRGPSGLSVGGIPYSFQDLTEEKMVLIKSPHLIM
jgi:acyl-CoA reductase-like NAD-dependent aldehyde dehydrogenase